MGNSRNNAFLNETVTFIQNAIPGFEAGIYRLEVSQALTEASGEDESGAPTGGEQIDDGDLKTQFDFAVSGDRFVLAKPDQDVLSVFPADNSSGSYETVFPHVVFPQPTLPWMRAPTVKHPEPDAQGDIPTWLWVLLLDDGDVASNNGLKLDPETGVIGDFFPASINPDSTLPGSGVSYFSGGGDESDLEPGQEMDTPVQYIDVPRSLFDEVAPTIDDLRLMAHVREVNLTKKPTIAGVSDRGVPTGRFSIAFGNRLPQSGGNTRCYLVSLEAMEPYLPGGDGGSSKSVRLAVLKNWRFRATGTPATFVDTLEALNNGTEDVAGHKRTVLQLEYGGDNAVLKSGLGMGYVPLNTIMRTGEKTVSWYRGPLPPYEIQPEGEAGSLPSADAGLAVDPTTGAFDMSYAAAWTIGRMVALQDQSFSVPFYVWKKDLHNALTTAVSGRILGERLESFGFQLRSPTDNGEAAASQFEDLLHILVHSLKQE